MSQVQYSREEIRNWLIAGGAVIFFLVVLPLVIALSPEDLWDYSHTFWQKLMQGMITGAIGLILLTLFLGFKLWDEVTERKSRREARRNLRRISHSFKE